MIYDARNRSKAMASKYSDEELTGRVKSPGWCLVSDKNAPRVTGTLEDVLKSAHQRQNGSTDGALPPGIEELETSITLDMIQIERLWRYLGLPV
jgi:hypothetical protein